MKKNILWLGMLAIILTFMVAVVGCDNNPADNKDNPQTITYTGTSGSTTYILVITGNTVQIGNAYELTVGAKKSAGTVSNVSGGVLTLTPSNATTPFTTTVSGSSLTAMNGTITYTDNTTDNAPGELTPVGGNMAWTAVTDSTFASDISIIAYGNGKFVAVGYLENASNKMAYSSDGITWTDVANSPFSSSNGDYIRGITYGNNKFVAVGSVGGSDKIAYSPDGVTWTEIARADSTLIISGITYGNDKFVGIYWNGIVYSHDCVTWTAVEKSTFSFDYGYDDIQAIAYGNNIFVAVGSNGKMVYSSDGITWTAVTDSTFGNTHISAIAYGNNKFVAGGDKGKAAYSPDGITWTAIADSKIGHTYSSFYGYLDIYAIAYGNNEFVAGGQGGKMAYSSDGINWTAVEDSTFDYSGIHAIAYGNEKFVAGGSDGKMAYSSGNNGSGGGTDPTITTASLPNGTVGTPYSQTLTATGATPITWSIATGSLPNGLTLSTAGVISGTPTTANTFNFTVKATNTAGNNTKALSIVIAASSGGSKWWTWHSSLADGEGDYVTTANVSITPTPDDTGVDVTVTGTANPQWYNWSVWIGYSYTATAGKTYRVSWKWKADSAAFENVTIQYVQQKDFQDDNKYQLGTNTSRLTIPTTEETKTFEFTMPANLNTFVTPQFVFKVGEDTGSFSIRDFSIVDVTTPGSGNGGTFTLTGIPSQYNGKYALLTGTDGSDDYMLYGCQSFNMTTETATLIQISNGSVSIPMWKFDENGNSVRYSGNSTTGAVYVAIFNAQTYSASSIGEQIAIWDVNEFFTFSNGSATRTWSQGTVSSY